MSSELIRNFSIIAHIDHGKSTLADRILELTQTVEKRIMKEQYLDNMDIERERGITIKAVSVKLNYKAQNGKTYTFNLIDTPGHVDFSYEVSRALAACDGALLVVDATQGIQAQTLANVYLAVDNDLEIIPVLNKIDLPSAMPEQVKEEIEEVIGIDCSDACCISAKTGEGVKELLEKIVELIPEPVGDKNEKLKALIFDSQFDSYRGVIIYVRIFEGSIKTNDNIFMMKNNSIFEVQEIGTFNPKMTKCKELNAGDVGYIIANIKNVSNCKVGDTITHNDNRAEIPLKGYKEAKPYVFCGIYPIDPAKYNNLKDALSKMQLNDSSLDFTPETSAALGFGLRCGFLGLLHMEIIQERLEREFDLELLTTAPSVNYKINLTKGRHIFLDNPMNMPKINEIESMEEPFVNVKLITPTEYVGSLMELCQDKRGTFITMKYITKTRSELEYDMPLAEIVLDFYDKLKSRTKGYASMEYEIKDYRKSELVKLDILVNEEIVDALSFIVHKEKSYARGRQLCEKLKELISKQMFKVPIQAAIGGKIIARETISAKRKDVTAKCYGGDITRKRKLLEKQKSGKKKMKEVGSVTIPQKAFRAVLKLD